MFTHVQTYASDTSDQMTSHHVSYDIIITPHHATPGLIRSHHVASRHIASCRVTPRHATPRHDTPRHATPRHVTPSHCIRPPHTHKVVYYNCAMLCDSNAISCRKHAHVLKQAPLGACTAALARKSRAGRRSGLR